MSQVRHVLTMTVVSSLPVPLRKQAGIVAMHGTFIVAHELGFYPSDMVAHLIQKAEHVCRLH